MKFKETILSLIVLLLIFFDIELPFYNLQVNAEPAVTNDEIGYSYVGESESQTFFDVFEKTPLIIDNGINADFLLNANDEIKKEYFYLPYKDLAFLTEKIVVKLAKVNINGKINKIVVNGTSKNASIVFSVTLDVKKQNFLTKLVGLKSNIVNATICVNADLDRKTASSSFRVEELNLSPFVVKIACNYLFGTTDYDALMTNVLNKIFWGIGEATGFEKEGVVYNEA